ncbi:hypothetical protein CC80DRAFT_486719 [Byssothecium circinans]|uniref:Uncharacterized protein n=1 Tax=Byssothecium circinans TaxID=147558 RepID=A0A6A5UF39_9PLEO|nr:hypothetical protein CC80DRAFT_486719 [Byssothecium circinans]
MPSLTPRDNMGYAIHPAGIVVLCILGSGVLVFILFGMFRFYGQPNANEGTYRPMTVEQMSYIKDVRDRNLEELAYEGRKGMFGGKGRVHGR